MTQQKESTVKRFFKNPEIIINTSLYGVAIYFAIMGMISKSINQLLQAIFVALTTIAITQLLSSYTSFRMNLKESEIISPNSLFFLNSIFLSVIQ